MDKAKQLGVKAITEEERADFEEKAKSEIEFAKFSLKLFNDLVLANKEYLELITGNVYTMKSYYMGLVTADGGLEHYDGTLTIMDKAGQVAARCNPINAPASCGTLSMK